MTNLVTTAHLTGELLHNRYKVTYPLGRGGIGITYAAQDLQTGQAVALKVLSLRREADWKKLELFEREAKVLAQLNHPAIPSYIDYFQIETERDYSFCIVQQLAPGQSLEQWIDEDWQPSLEEIEQFSIQLLEILIYLQTLLPPVIHRDIKPQNVIRQQNGQIFLVDFGSVQDTFRQNVTRGSTVVGTFGYMAPEQFRGQAVPSTDLYGLGTTLLFLLIGDSPADLPQRKLKIDFRAALPFKDTFFADWLERLLEPRPEHRFVDAQAALNVLKRTQPLPLLPTPNIKPLSCPIQVERTADTLSIKIPGVGLRTPQMQRFAIANLLWNGFLAFVLFMMVSLQLFLAQGKLMGFGLIVAIGLGVVARIEVADKAWFKV
ncbi:MAG: serine/threonine-protein kinase [Cyanobacteria bacterium P01_A01_bin.17]